jgi:hypothetical protein
MNLVIEDDEGQVIYGHQVLRHISQTRKTLEVNMVRGIVPECYITYVSRQFPDIKEVRDLAASDKVTGRLLEKVSNRIQLGVADVVAMFRSQSRVQEESDVRH